MNTGIRASRENIVETMVITVEESGDVLLTGVDFVTRGGFSTGVVFSTDVSGSGGISSKESSSRPQRYFNVPTQSEAFSAFTQYTSLETVAEGQCLSGTLR